MKQSLILAAAALAAAASAPALAQSNDAAFTFSVDRSGLTEVRAETAYDRLQAEAARYCASIELNSRHALETCERDVVATVVARIDDPALSARHAEAVRAGSSFASLDQR